MDIFDEFIESLGTYSKDEISDIRYWYARALTATDYLSIKVFCVIGIPGSDPFRNFDRYPVSPDFISAGCWLLGN